MGRSKQFPTTRGERQAVSHHVFADAQEVWGDCERYTSIDATLKILETFRPANPQSRREYRRRITGLFNELEEIESKYPFIDNPLSREWGSRLIAEYRYRRYTKK